MAKYSMTVPDAEVHGVSLKIVNGGAAVNGIYSAVGVFVDNGNGDIFPLITVGKQDLVNLPANSTVYIYEHYVTPMQFRENVRIVVDSTDLPDTCILQPVFLLGVEG